MATIQGVEARAARQGYKTEHFRFNQPKYLLAKGQLESCPPLVLHSFNDWMEVER